MSRVPKSLRRFSIDPMEMLHRGGLYEPAEVGAYLRLLCFIWNDGGKTPSLPFHDEASLARLSGLGTRRWRQSGPNIMRHFEVRDGSLYSPMLTEQWERRAATLSRPSINLPKNARPGSRGKTKNHSRVQVKGERRAALLARDGNRCVWCGGTENLCLDHVVPVSLGGDDSDDNYQVLCMNCNSRKGSSEAAE